MNPELSTEASDLLKRALGLPADARAALANSLLESLDDAADASAEEEWNQEVARRLQELDSGVVKTIPWGEAKRRISAMLNDK